jgi:hypothetical protein
VVVVVAVPARGADDHEPPGADRANPGGRAAMADQRIAGALPYASCATGGFSS